MNLLGTVAAAEVMDLDPKETARILAGSRGAPGRLERVGQNGDYLVLVDYSHTPGALAAALETLRELNPTRLICVFGCGGDRDKGKRPLMAKEAGRLADVAVLTSDNPRTEDPLAIMADAARGFEEAGLTASESCSRVGRNHGTYLAEPDRALAIKAACGMMEAGDILLIAGKGHEDYQIIGTTKRHFDDRKEALEALEALGRA
jgi:UDP-N-acetylmuramoyl-L-alanyl-D-glutamate--2,6-diaminopimelate ligase